MKKQDFITLLRLMLVPILLILLGLILVMEPDTASALISRLLGYAMILGAVVTGLAALFREKGKVAKGTTAVILAVVGGWLVSHPLMLMAWIGRFMGVLILINSLPDLFYARKFGGNILFDFIAAIMGAVLVMLPMTASRLVFTLCGFVVLLIGSFMLFDRLRSRRWLTEGDDPNIIDAL